MRKQIIDQEVIKTSATEEQWLDLEQKAQVELSSEDPEFPIEGALEMGSRGWRASKPGKQKIRIIFNEPQRIRRIQLGFEETQQERTQEFVLEYSSDGGQSYQEIVRQQFNFSPSHANKELEDYTVNLDWVTAVSLQIIPDINQSNLPASLSYLRIA